MDTVRYSRYDESIVSAFHLWKRLVIMYDYYEIGFLVLRRRLWFFGCEMSDDAIVFTDFGEDMNP
jgi:hypothetical protein